MLSERAGWWPVCVMLCLCLTPSPDVGVQTEVDCCSAFRENVWSTLLRFQTRQVITPGLLSLSTITRQRNGKIFIIYYSLHNLYTFHSLWIHFLETFERLSRHTSAINLLVHVQAWALITLLLILLVVRVCIGVYNTLCTSVPFEYIWKLEGVHAVIGLFTWNYYSLISGGLKSAAVVADLSETTFSGTDGDHV